MPTRATLPIDLITDYNGSPASSRATVGACANLYCLPGAKDKKIPSGPNTKMLLLAMVTIKKLIEKQNGQDGHRKRLATFSDLANLMPAMEVQGNGPLSFETLQISFHFRELGTRNVLVRS